MGDTLDDREALRRLLGRTRAVLFDFDGPVCDLFGNASTAPVAKEIKKAVGDIWGTLDPDVEACEDSHGILQRIRDMFDRPATPPRSREALEQADAIVTRHEYEAVNSAELAPDFVRLVNLLLGLGMRLVIVSNNSAGPVWELLKREGLQSKFEEVFGRDPHEPRHMKPDPDSLLRSLTYLELAPSECLMVGDQLTDLTAARSARTWFLGYARTGERAAEMTRHGAHQVVTSHAPFIDAAELLRKSN